MSGEPADVGSWPTVEVDDGIVVSMLRAGALARSAAGDLYLTDKGVAIIEANLRALDPGAPS